MTVTKLKLGVVSAVIVAGLIVLFLRQDQNNSAEQSNSPHLSASENASGSAVTPRSGDRASSRFSRSEADAAPVATAQKIVAGKLVQFGRSRREFAEALARRHGVEVPDAVKLFFAERPTDSQRLCACAEHRSQLAFAELVRRHDCFVRCWKRPLDELPKPISPDPRGARRILIQPPGRRRSSPSPPVEDERAGERRPILLNTPLPDPLPARSSRGEGEDFWRLYPDAIPVEPGRLFCV